jgi:hypothetical protein
MPRLICWSSLRLCASSRGLFGKSRTGAAPAAARPLDASLPGLDIGGVNVPGLAEPGFVPGVVGEAGFGAAAAPRPDGPPPVAPADPPADVPWAEAPLSVAALTRQARRTGNRTIACSLAKSSRQLMATTPRIETAYPEHRRPARSPRRGVRRLSGWVKCRRVARLRSPYRRWADCRARQARPRRGCARSPASFAPPPRRGRPQPELRRAEPSHPSPPRG